MVNFPDLCESLALPGFQNLRNLYLPSRFRGDQWYPGRPVRDAVAEAEHEAKWEGFQSICDEKSIRFSFVKLIYW